MVEYIEREALKQRLGDLHFQNYGNAILAVIEAPAADVVEVVRCKDCKHGSIDDHTGKGLCRNPFGGYGCVPTNEDGFCSYGERRVNDG